MIEKKRREREDPLKNQEVCKRCLDNVYEIVVESGRGKEEI